MFGNVVKPWHLLILVAVLILLFGAKRLPGAARSLGRSLRIMKSETRGLVDDPEPDDLDEKASAQSGRQPLHREQGTEEARTGETRAGEARTGETRAGEARTGEVVDPPERASER